MKFVACMFLDASSIPYCIRGVWRNFLMKWGLFDSRERMVVMTHSHIPRS